MLEYKLEYDNDTVKEYVKKQKQLLKEEVNKLPTAPLLSVIQVGNNPASNSYIKGKLKDCNEVGILCDHTHFDENVTEEELLECIREQNENDIFNGIIVQLPLPKHIDVKKVQLAISPTKDTDGFNPLSKFHPCTPQGVINFLLSQDYNFEGKNAVVIGRSDIVGKPLAQMLTDLNATVTLCHSKSDYLEYMSIADIVFTCINKIEYFKEEDFDFKKFGYCYPYDIIDIGLGVGEDGKLHGNIKKESIEKLRYEDSNVISGIGGVGLLTRLELLRNTYQAYINQN